MPSSSLLPHRRPSPEILPVCFLLEVTSGKTNSLRWEESEIMWGKGPPRDKYLPAQYCRVVLEVSQGREGDEGPGP